MVDGQGTACKLSEVAQRGTGGETMGMCGMLGLQSEGYALESALGTSSLYIWALGLLAAGQASTMVCTYAGQIIMNGMLNIELPAWKRVALTRLVAIGPSLVVAFWARSVPGLLNTVNEHLNIMQSMLIPFAMLPVLHFASSSRLLGRLNLSTAKVKKTPDGSAAAAEEDAAAAALSGRLRGLMRCASRPSHPTGAGRRRGR